MIFSIIVPIYNVSQYLDECISSVLNQDFSDYELILVDDGSTDEGGNICQKYALSDDRIKYISKENGGLTSARKAGAQVATGDYIVSLDGDDALMPGCLCSIADIIDKYKPDCICTGYKRITASNSSEIVTNSMPTGLYAEEAMATVRGNLFYSQSIKGNNWGRINVTIWSKIVKREIYVPCQISMSEDIELGEDIALVSLIIKESSSVYFADVISHQYRVRQDSLTHTFSCGGVESIIEVLNQVRESVEDANQVAILGIHLFSSELARASKWLSYKETKDKVVNRFKAQTEMYRFIKSATISKPTLGKDSIKFFMFKHELFYLIYLYFKFFSK